MASLSGKRQVSFSKWDICLEWTPEEQAILLRGLQKYASEPAFIRCLNISNELPNKTTRDVACRARWVSEKLNDKRRNHGHNLTSQGHNLTSQGHNKTGIDNSGTSQSVYDEILRKVLGGPFRELFEKNANVLNEISANLGHFKMYENFILFHGVKHNLESLANIIL